MLVLCMLMLCFVCSAVAGCTDSVADIVFVVDSSGSIRDANPRDRSYDNWQLMLRFISDFVDALDISPSTNQIGAIRFSDIGENLWFLNRHQNKRSLMSAINSIGYIGSNTNTSGGIRALAQQFTPARGDRPEAKNIAIILTDGASTFDRQRTVPDAEQARRNGIEIFSVGITTQVNEDELKRMSSPPQQIEKNYFLSTDFVELNKIREQIIKETCSASQVGKVPIVEKPDFMLY